MLWNLIWVDDSILGGRAPGMLSVIPIQERAQAGLSSSSAVLTLCRRFPPHLQSADVFARVYYLAPTPPPSHPRLLSEATPCFSFYRTNDVS